MTLYHLLTSVSETIQKATDCHEVLPPSESLNKFHRWQTNKQTDRWKDTASHA